jgi:hypothetical protein
MKLKKLNKNDAITEIAAPTALATVSIVNPIVGIIATFLYGTVKSIVRWKSERIGEITKNVGATKLIKLINKDDKTRDILHKILENVIDESSSKKRKMFYVYIKNLDKVNNTNFDYHTKLISVLNAITFNELDMLWSFSKDFKEIEILNNKKDINSKIPSGVNVSQIMKHKHYDQISPEYLEYTLTSLSNYGLIYTAFGRFDGTMFGPVTYFGREFMNYINTK